MPRHHQFYASWSAEKFISWAEGVGEETMLAITYFLDSKQHKEQAYQSCVGIFSLAKKSSSSDLNIACRKAWNYNRISYTEVKKYPEDLVLNCKLNFQLPVFMWHYIIGAPTHYCRRDYGSAGFNSHRIELKGGQ
ncbi:hypothetical protein [Marispirochaeta sp.]|uniref:hypothetical protein n=1 Tax=Marispirochaeta sp. TaxID=2038653 RepID=UPI0029C8FBEE|nr:hypothetical protein [Marispirochaeta sp.]